MRASTAFIVLLAMLTLGACGGGDSPVVPPGGGASGIVVRGVVLGVDGLPRALSPVALLGRGPIATDPWGRFRFDGVHVPYDVVLFDPGSPQVTLYEGLTRADPKLVLYDEYRGHHSALSGSASGGVGFPTPAGVRTWASVVGPRGLDWGGQVNPTTGNWTLTDVLAWAGPVNMDATLIAWQYTGDANGIPVDFKGWGTSPVLLRSGLDQSSIPLTMIDPPTMSISGTYVPAPGTNFDYALLTVDLDATTHVRLRRDTFASSGTFQLRGPQLAGATYTAEVRTEAAGGVFSIARATNLAAFDSGLDLSTFPLHAINGPPDGATGVDYETEFTFAPSLLGLHMLTVSTGYGGADMNPTFHIVTGATTVRIPDLRAYGLGLPSLVTYTWAVEAWGPFDSVDAMAASGSLWAPTPVAHHTRHAVRMLTTAP